MDQITAAVVQAEQPGTWRTGLLARTRELAAEAARQGASLIVFPETWLPGYPAWIDYCRDAGLWDHPPVKAVFSRLVADSVVVGGDSFADPRRDRPGPEITLVVGVSERVAAGPGRGTLFNTLLTIGPDGELLNHHRKLTPDLHGASALGAGRHRRAPGRRHAGGSGGRSHLLGALEPPGPPGHARLRRGCARGVWSAVVGANGIHQEASRCYAFEGRCHVIAAGQLMRAAALPPELEPSPAKVQSPDQWLLRGGSAIIAPDAGYLAGPLYDEPGILVAELDYRRNREEP
jgi:nitrilase